MARNSLHPSHSSFYIGEEEEEEGELISQNESHNTTSNADDVLEIPKLRTSRIEHGNKFSSVEASNNRGGASAGAGWATRSPSISSTSSSTSNANTTTTTTQDVLQFPIESSHAYSYAHLSPNSLALRLNVLKRSLEILKDRPDLFKSIKDDTDGTPLQRSQSHTHDTAKIDGLQVPTPSSTLRSMYKHSSANNSSEFQSPTTGKKKLQSNASSAALAALFRPPLQRSGSLPINTVKPEVKPPPQYSNLKQEMNYEDNSNSKSKSNNSDVILSDDLKDIIRILQNDGNFVADNSEVALNLHQLSLASAGDQNQLKQDIIINKLLHALATPFVENSVMTPSLLASEITASSVTSTQLISPASALNLFNPSNSISSSYQPPPTPISANSRPFHSMTSGKHALPQAVFTVDVETPWNVKAANDLACLMFGISKNMIKSLTLMDLIAPQFRQFVSEKISYQSLNGNNKNNIIFAGEIVAILRPGDNDFAWTSVWAKRRGNMIICMFDQILCDAFDVVISRDSHKSDYKIDSVKEVAGKLITKFISSMVNKEVSSISESIKLELESNQVEEGDSREFYDSNKINDIRYFTLQLKSENQVIPENIPCAVTSNPIERDDNKQEIKVKIHTLPYIAGIFVINSSTYNILSCNNAIARNLFGHSSEELNDKTVDFLIPSFSEILRMGIDDNTDFFNIIPGLVLPEHFFRKYDAMRRRSKNLLSKDLSEEELFFTSKGIEGIHRDGKSLWIDVQLRASSADTLVLWITYSRSADNVGKIEMSEELEKLSAHSSTLSLYSAGEKAKSGSGDGGNGEGGTASSTVSIGDLERKAKVDFKSKTALNQKGLSVNLPSQMNLLQAYESDLPDIGSSSEVSRQSSTRRLRTGSSSHSVNSASSSRKPNIKEDETAEAERDDKATTRSKNIYTNLVKSDSEIIALENEMLEEKIKNSTQWPSVVGAKRRTKKFSEFIVLKDMGEGAYGKVELVVHKEDPAYKIIIKCIDKERILVDTWVRDRKLGTIPSEINVMAFLNSEPHPNIMRIIDFFEDSKYYYLETPLFGDPPAIDLFDFIEIKNNMTETECKFIFKQVVSAIYHLHKNGIVHRDIKDENVIVDEHGIIKLIDFGSAGWVKSGPFDVFVGTIDYASPEVLKGERYNGKPQDIWALGILLYTMIYKENPFYNVDEIMEGDLRIPFVLSEGSEKLIRKILVREIDERPTITDIVEDPWLEIL
ncbi:serine/threonine-protein kinase Psk1p [[Candida] railenensis]|uniref:non-specific serine/threonine protein kinase n=1 Tax=[Candida] railenensis TaxID=45579 RepID=A0A9P0VVZ8_9ASCO|nr:serine/threonine-protein kinase Psk1p [[Candida] railenensis]